MKLKQKTTYSFLGNQKIKAVDYFYNKKGKLNKVLFYYPDSKKVARKDSVINIGFIEIYISDCYISFSIKKDNRTYLKLNKYGVEIFWYNNDGNIIQHISKSNELKYKKIFKYDRFGYLMKSLTYLDNKFHSQCNYNFDYKESKYNFHDTDINADGLCHINKENGMIDFDMVYNNDKLCDIYMYDPYDNQLCLIKEVDGEFIYIYLNELKYWD